jgi:ribosomal protein S18 acetylase RimI-like enzyme
MDIVYRELNKQDLHRNLLKDFNRYQEVIYDWCPIQNGEYALVLQPHIEDWNEKAKEIKVSCLSNLLHSGGKIFSAFDSDKLIGFSAINGILLGTNKQYIELAEFHVSFEYRGKGIGKKLFDLCVEAASYYECEKLYIVASSSEESQKVYRKLGCVYTTELIPLLYEQSPADVHLEYLLTK